MTKQEIEAFVRQNSEYYYLEWVPLVEGDKPRFGFNWAAFFLTGLWLAYRKMYKATVVFYSMMLLVVIFEELAFADSLGQAETPAGWERLVPIVIAFIFGKFGTRWYFNHACHVIIPIRSEGLSEDAYMQTLAKRGGTSVGAAIGFFLVFFAALSGVALVI